MGDHADKVRAKSSRDRKTVSLVVEDPRWYLPVRVVGLLLLLVLVGLGSRTLFPVTEVVNIPVPLTPSQSAQVLGLPMKFTGFTLVDTHGPGSTVRLDTKCPNCSFPATAVTITWPEPPGPGWRKYDLGTPEYRRAYDTNKQMASRRD